MTQSFRSTAVQGACALVATCAAVVLVAAPQSAASTGAASGASATATSKWVEIHRGSLHSIYADIGAADWSLPTVQTKILGYQRQGVL